MVICVISIIVAVICYVVGKKRVILKNNFEIITHILWIEACIFMAGYFLTDKYVYREIWMILMVIAGVFFYYL